MKHFVSNICLIIMIMSITFYFSFRAGLVYLISNVFELYLEDDSMYFSSLTYIIVLDSKCHACKSQIMAKPCLYSHLTSTVTNIKKNLLLFKKEFLVHCMTCMYSYSSTPHIEARLHCVAMPMVVLFIEFKILPT